MVTMANSETRLIIKKLKTNYQRYFLRAYQYQYWLVIVNNHFEDVYSVFLYTQKIKTKLTRSYELVYFSRSDQQYQDVQTALKQFSNLSISYRDTPHLIHPGRNVALDRVHGHNS